MAAADTSGLPAGYPFNPQLEITPRQLKAALADPAPNILLIDCRTQGEWNTARIEGATLIPLNQIAARAAEIQSAAAGRPIAIHCHHGGRSMQAAMFLRSRGLDARSVAGGIDLWSIDINPSVPRY
jgi:rhodanese-related sulfurtransferase